MPGIKKTPTTTYLTPDMAGAVASVAVMWSHLELELEHTIRKLGKIPHKTARVLVTGMNAKTRFGCIEGLLQLRPSITPALIQEFKKIANDATEKVEKNRNKIVHGIWHRTKKGDYFLIRTSGNWTPPGKRGIVKRAVHAELESINSAKIRAIEWEISEILIRLDLWRAKLPA